MRQHFYILLVIIFTISLSGCKKNIGPEECFMAWGHDDSKEIFLAQFDQIVVKDRFKIIITQDTTQPLKVVIKGGSNVIKQISAVTDNGKLTVEDKNICNWTRDFTKRLTIEINCHALHGITVFDDCEILKTEKIFSDSLVIVQRSTSNLSVNLNCGKLEMNHKGQGEVNLKGYAAIFVPVLYDAGKLFARELTGDYIFVYHYGLNEVHVSPFKVLFVNVGNTGGTYYYAEPRDEPVLVNRTGSGEVARR